MKVSVRLCCSLLILSLSVAIGCSQDKSQPPQQANASQPESPSDDDAKAVDSQENSQSDAATATGEKADSVEDSAATASNESATASADKSIATPTADSTEAVQTKKEELADSGDTKTTTDKKPRTLEVLQEQTEVQFVDTPLADALQFLASIHGVSIKLAPGLKKDTPINVIKSGQTLAEVLKTILTPLEMSYRVDEAGVIQVEAS